MADLLVRFYKTWLAARFVGWRLITVTRLAWWMVWADDDPDGLPDETLLGIVEAAEPRGLQHPCFGTQPGDEEWWTISGSALLGSLRRAFRGEDPDLVYAELWANSEVSVDDDGEG